MLGIYQLRRVLFQHCGHRFRRRIAAKGAMPGEHFIQNRAEGENVRARVDEFSANLFGSHIAGSSHDQAGRGLRTGHRSPVRIRTHAAGLL